MNVNKIEHFEVHGDYVEHNGLDEASLKQFFSSLEIALRKEKSETKREKILREAYAFIRDTASSILSGVVANQLFK